jgi:uncharacterized repeat protein (TIGR01451 family)
MPDQNAADQVCKAANGFCTLRAAIQQSNSVMGTDQVNVPAGTYPVGSQLPIDSAMTIVGTAGARSTTLNLGGTAGALTMDSQGPINISGLAVTNGGGTGPPVYVNGPEVTLTGLWIHDNTNSGGNGGGVSVFSGSLNVVRSSITDNKVTSGSFALGGGVNVSGGNVVIESTTIARNTAQGGAGGTSARGGGIYTNGTSLVLRHVTLTDNIATAGSASIAGGNLGISGDTSIADSIITEGTALTGADCYNDGTGGLTATGKNIYANAAGNCPLPAGNVVAPPAGLAALGDYGGPGGLTRVPAVGSPAVDAAGACPATNVDQRGAAAPAGAACDIGAAELGADLQLSLKSSAGSTGPGDQVTYVAAVVNAGVDDAPGTIVELTPPSGATVVLVSPSQGTCAAPATCNLGALASGESASVTVVVSAPESGTMQASASARSDIPDPTPANAVVAGEVIQVVPGGDSTPPTETPGDDTPPPPVVVPDTTAPIISKLAVNGKLRAKKRAKLQLTLSEAATVTFTVTRQVRGRRVRGKCRPKAKTGRRCTITKRVGAFSVALPQGDSVVSLPAKLAKKLKKGRYRVQAAAKDAAGNAAKPATLKIRIR